MEFSSQYRASILMTLLLTAVVAASAAAGASESLTADRIAASLEGEIISLSEMAWFVAFRGFRIPETREERQKAYREVLDLLVDLKVIAREAEIAPFLSLENERIDKFIAQYEQRLPAGESLDERLHRWGMSREDFREMVHRDLIVNEFVRVRFEPFVVVSPKEVSGYYQNEFAAQFRANGQLLPPLTLVEENIRQILLNRKKNAQLEEWIRRARRQIEVEVLLFRSPSRSPNLPKSLRQEETELTPIPKVDSR